MQSGVQLWSVSHALEVMLELSERIDVIDSLRAAALLPRGTNVSGEDAERLLKQPVSSVVQLPPTLPLLVNVGPEWGAANYSLSAEQKQQHPLAGELQARNPAQPAPPPLPPLTPLSAGAQRLRNLCHSVGP